MASAGAGFGARTVSIDDADAADTSDGSPYGFGIRVIGGAGFVANGTWGVTAP
jgi:hypothetical protein